MHGSQRAFGRGIYSKTLTHSCSFAFFTRRPTSVGWDLCGREDDFSFRHSLFSAVGIFLFHTCRNMLVTYMWYVPGQVGTPCDSRLKSKRALPPSFSLSSLFPITAPTLRPLSASAKKRAAWLKPNRLTKAGGVTLVVANLLVLLLRSCPQPLETRRTSSGTRAPPGTLGV